VRNIPEERSSHQHRGGSAKTLQPDQPQRHRPAACHGPAASFHFLRLISHLFPQIKLKNVII
jgi:hypothetical protein